MINKIRSAYKDVMFVSKITNTKNKKLRISLTIILANGVAAVDILLILVFTSIITNSVQSGNILGFVLEIFLRFKFLIPILVIFRFIFVYIQSINMKDLEFTINRNLKVLLLDEVFDKSNYSISDAYFYVNELTGHLTFFYANLTAFLMSTIQIFAYSYYLVNSDISTLFYFSGGIAILYYPLKAIISRARNFTDQAYWKAQSLSSVIEKVVENMFLIKILKKDREEIDKFNSEIKSFNNTQLRQIIWGSLSGYLPTFLTMFVLGVLVSFSSVVKNLTLDFIGVTLRLFQQLGALSSAFNGIVNSQVHIKHFTNLEKNKTSVNKDSYQVSTSIPKFAVEIKDINFKYFNSDNNIFESTSLQVPINEHTIITGPNGSGKSTLLGIIAGVLYPQSGNVMISSKNLGYIGATPFIFKDTLRNNLLYGNSKVVTDEMLIKKLDQFDVFKEKSGNDLDKVISNKSLSSGQMQKVAFIRALISGVEILLLDESTSNLDTETKDLLFKLIKKQKNLTIINSTHDPDNFSYASNHVKISIIDEKREVEISKII
jgi:ABC-type multidrug transport system fused ATPase/permease subunit|tara:strand:+ start:3440 stop:5074 length:1635 start_codon:yes stop_codon:yes gene_type:complete